MLKFKADILFPINSPPIPDGILITDYSGKIYDVINPSQIDYNIPDIRTLNGFLCPGFINTHAHTELSHLAKQITPSKGLNSFILELQDKRKSNREQILDAIRKADESMLENGIVAVADVCNSDISFKIKTVSKLYYHNFIELYGSDQNNADTFFEKGCCLLNDAKKLGLNASVTPHSFYATSSKLLKLIFKHTANESRFLSLHHLESDEELSFYYNKSGPIISRMNYFNVDISGFKPSQKTPLQTHAHILPPDVNKLLVHNTFIAETDLGFAQKELINLWWCLCPNSNLYIDYKLPDVPLMLNYNCKLTIGTDSLASNTQLNVLYELITLQKLFKLSTQALLEIATINGAQYMKLDNNLGSFEKNKTPGIVHITKVNSQNTLLTENSKASRLL